MVRRLISTAALVGCAAAYIGAYTAAPERATFILTSGERKSGPVVFHGSNNENLINGYLNLGVDTGGPEFTVPVDQVAVIDFVGGQPPATELGSVQSGHALAMRNGTVEQGQFVNIINGATVRWRDSSGNTRDIPISQVSRIYLNPASAFTAYNYSRGTAPVGTAGLAPGAIRVNANQAWTSSGVTVRRGDMVRFSTTGQIQFGTGADQTATPDGNDTVRNPAFPVPALPVGALIGRVGNSQPFAIGSNASAIQMPAAGTLMLGINDNEPADNSGFFSVVVAKQ
jgi:hypothetical protein